MLSSSHHHSRWLRKRNRRFWCLWTICEPRSIKHLKQSQRKVKRREWSTGSTSTLLWRSYQIADWIEINDIRRKSEKLQGRMGEQPDVFEIIQLSLSQLTEHYTIKKSQARKSFNFSVIAIAAGLVTIIGGVWLIYSKTLDIIVGTISAVSEVLLQFFMVANFYIYNKSLKQIHYF